jgi:hypothetical protein
MGIKVIFTDLLAVKVIIGVEVPDLAGKAGLGPGSIKMGNRCCTAYSFNQVAPKLPNRISQGSNHTQTSYNNSSQSFLING